MPAGQELHALQTVLDEVVHKLCAYVTPDVHTVQPEHTRSEVVVHCAAISKRSDE